MNKQQRDMIQKARNEYIAQVYGDSFLTALLYGPYRYRRSRRLYVIVSNVVTGKKETQSFPVYLMERHLNRKLEKTEKVVYKNGRPEDNSLTNLLVVPNDGKRQKYDVPYKVVNIINGVVEEVN